MIKLTRGSLIVIFILLTTGFAVRAGTDNSSLHSERHHEPLMYDMDSYYNLRLAMNLLDHGELSDGDGWDRHSYYPPGVPLDYPPLLAFITIILHLLTSRFLSLSELAFWLPAVVSPLAGVAVFLFAGSLDCDDLSSGLAGLLAVTAPFYFMRTVPGFYDTDIFNVLFPLMVVHSLYLSVRRDDWGWNTVSAMLITLYSTAWNGWQILYYVLLVSCGIFILRYRDRNILLFLLITTALIELTGPGRIPSLIRVIPLMASGAAGQLFPEILNTGSSTMTGAFPSPYANITELQPPGFAEIITGTGPGLLIAGIMGLEPLRRLRGDDGFLFMTVMIWLVAGLVCLSGGLRFIEVLIAPLSVTSALFFSEIRTRLARRKNMDPPFRSLLSASIIVMLVLPSPLIALDSYGSLHPRVDDCMMDAAVYIRENTAEDTVVVCNWVHGHFFAWMADRPVNFDGRLGYIETLPVRNHGYPLDPRVPGVWREYWQDRALATSDPVLADGILSMLASSGDECYLEVYDATGDPAGSVRIIEELIRMDEDQRMTYLESLGISTSAADSIAALMERRSGYVLVTSDSLIDKGYWILYYGSWNFTGPTVKPFYSEGEIISRNPLISSDGVTFNGTVLFKGMKPCRVFTVKEGWVDVVTVDPSSGFNVYILKDRNRTVTVPVKYEDSLFVRLVLMGDGAGRFRAVMRSGDVTLWEPIE